MMSLASFTVMPARCDRYWWIEQKHNNKFKWGDATQNLLCIRSTCWVTVSIQSTMLLQVVLETNHLKCLYHEHMPGKSVDIHSAALPIVSCKDPAVPFFYLYQLHSAWLSSPGHHSSLGYSKVVAAVPKTFKHTTRLCLGTRPTDNQVKAMATAVCISSQWSKPFEARTCCWHHHILDHACWPLGCHSPLRNFLTSYPLQLQSPKNSSYVFYACQQTLHRWQDVQHCAKSPHQQG